MSSLLTKKPVKIPVKLVNGVWEYFHGGALPIKEGSIADLIIDKTDIEESLDGRKFKENLSFKSRYKVLDENVELLIALAVDIDVPQHEFDKYFIKLTPNKLSYDYFEVQRSVNTKFVRVSIGKPTEIQSKHHPLITEGGLWLCFEGTQPKGVISSKINTPALGNNLTCDSLNHAFTRLSEKYETKRKSHTGNIYERVLYKEDNDQWAPLNLLRNAALAKDEQKLVKRIWSDIAIKLSLR